MVAEKVDDIVETDAALDVPSDGPNGIAVRGRGRRQLFMPDMGEDPLDLRLQFPVQDRVFEFSCAVETSEIVEKRPEALVEGQGYKHRKLSIMHAMIKTLFIIAILLTVITI